MTDTLDITAQPVSSLQLEQLKIEWVPYESVRPNSYNPNKMSWHERQLLRQSLLEDGWTQPIVTLEDGTIVDGEQRWTTAGMEIKPSTIQEVIDKMTKRSDQGATVSDSILFRLNESKSRLEAAIASGKKPNIAAVTGGLVPITRLDLGDDAHKMLSTIRHNRARGIHQIDSMAAITKDLVALGLDLDDLETRLGMDDEEIGRFLKSAEGQLGELQASLINTDFSQSWKPEHLSQLSPEGLAQFQGSADAHIAIKEAAVREAQRKQLLTEMVNDVVKQKEETTGATINQDEKDKIRKQLDEKMSHEKRELPSLVKIVLFITPEENGLIRDMWGKNVAAGLMGLVRAEAIRRAGVE